MDDRSNCSPARGTSHLGRGLDGDFTNEEVALIARFLMQVEASGQIGAEQQQRNQKRALTALRDRWLEGDYTYLWLDGLFMRARWKRRAVYTVVANLIAAREAGYRGSWN